MEVDQASPLRRSVDEWCENTAQDIPIYLWPSEIFQLIDELAALKPAGAREQFEIDMLESLGGQGDPLKYRRHEVRIRYGKEETQAPVMTATETVKPKGILGL